MTQKAIIGECRRILASLQINQHVGNEEDFNFLVSAFKKARYYAFKTQGHDIVKIEKRASGAYGTSCFFITMDDGRTTDFSYSKMFSKNPEVEDVLAAMRNAIDPVISDFRKSFKPFVHDGNMIMKVEDVDVDHYDMTFIELAAKWIDSKGGADSLISFVNGTEDGCTATRFVNQSIKDDFINYHNSHTHLRFLPKSVNRKLAKKKLKIINTK